MINHLTFTLIGDGSSDKALLNIIDWLLRDLYPTLPLKEQYADFRNLQKPPFKSDIKGQIEAAQKYYPFDILFYHRDAELVRKNIIDIRKREVFEVITQGVNVICVVPVVMMETWLLIDELAIKKASGNGNYKPSLNLPSLTKLESIKESKEILHGLLRNASGLKGRKLKDFNVHKAVHLVSEYITDFSKLRQLESFQIFEVDLREKMESLVIKS